MVLDDAVVVGAGLAGLVAAVRLLELGRRVRVVERASAVGGLCRHEPVDGLSFAIGCNDFGSGLARLIGRLGATVAFEPARTRFVVDGAAVTLPPDVLTLWRLLPSAVDLARMAVAAKRAPDEAWLGDLSERCCRTRRAADLVQLLPYGLGSSDMTLGTARAALSREHDYGYDKTVVPVGGPGAISAALASRVRELGGEVEIGVACTEIALDNGHFRVETERGIRVARQVVSSAPRWAAYPADAVPGLACALVCLAVDASVAWPDRMHALGFMPSPIREWVLALERGDLPPSVGFHLFRSRRDVVDGRYALSGFLFLPRGRENPTDADRAAHRENLDAGLDQLLPGLREGSEVTVIYPAEYRERFGCEPRPGPVQLPPGFVKPPSFDPSTGIHHVGNSVQPPGEHAAGAALSGWRAAEAVHRALEAS